MIITYRLLGRKKTCDYFVFIFLNEKSLLVIRDTCFAQSDFVQKKLSLMVIYSPGKCIDANGRKKAGRDTNPSNIKRP